ncbi:MAG: tRNA lysidine(34) synthetase TilS [Oscillospiraceae bacterium]|nr:tRNA lysidine(34) synthetase TilS [Oscillospiraceae bacterium]MBQ7130101.1 tRNA lysidine(34) synthetase TilS [Oscillospiraceae bacterium]
MLNKLTAVLRRYDMVQPGDTVICAVSGGADSVALLFAFYLLKDKLDIRLEAAHFNHHLRGEESCRDEAFVRDFCDCYDIPLHIGSGEVKAGKKGLEAAARDARYAFLRSLSGKVATAHTADDNAETVLLHLIRGTGLKGLGGITPVSGNVIRPMLTVTREDVERFLEEWCLRHIEDSSNGSDAFLRNRIRHHVMPLLREENPKIASNLSVMAQRLRLDEDFLGMQAAAETLPTVSVLRTMHPALRSRCLEAFLKRSGVREPEQSHLAAVEALVFSEKPSARAHLPGGVTIARNYDRLEKLEEQQTLTDAMLSCPGEAEFGPYRVVCTLAETIVNTPDAITVVPEGTLLLRPRRSGDSLRLSGGTKSVKKLLIDRKIPASLRDSLPVVCDDRGILGICGIGVNLDRAAKTLPAVTIRFIKKEK